MVSLLGRGRVGDTNDTAGKTVTSVASSQRVRVAASSKIVLILVDNDGASNDAVGSIELQEVVLVLVLKSGQTFGIGGDVAKISNVAVNVLGVTVALSVGVEVGTSRDASVAVVAELVDVESVMAGSQASDLGADADGSLSIVLSEDDSSLDVGRVVAENANSLDRHGDSDVEVGVEGGKEVERSGDEKEMRREEEKRDEICAPTLYQS